MNDAPAPIEGSGGLVVIRVEHTTWRPTIGAAKPRVRYRHDLCNRWVRNRNSMHSYLHAACWDEFFRSLALTD
jgi:hypothetical protein